MAKGHVVGAMWHLYFMHSEDFGFSDEDLICWFDSSNCRGYSVIGICFRIFSLVEANSFVLVSGSFDIWNLFSLDAAFWCSWKLFFAWCYIWM